MNLINAVYAAVKMIRSDLAKEYDVTPNGDHYNYFGLCNRACDMLVNMFKADPEMKVIVLHGEQRHHVRCPSVHWPEQHTWVMIKSHYGSLYVDPTCGQFKRLYADIPDYYISRVPPKWFMRDKHNIAFTKIGSIIDQKIHIPIKVTDSQGRHYMMHTGLISFLQYDVWGTISDMIRLFMGKPI